MTRPLFTNRLIHEKSPYLLQHAHNPVDWYPWGEEAFRLAKEQDKPIFLSIGYATCHWCHVMETESFQNIDVAKLLNETFINIKVDREEIPEVDGLYMEFAQAMMSGGAGWPLNLILTPELLPFFASTYLPPDSKKGYLGLKQLVARIHAIWTDRNERENVVMQAGKIVEVFANQAEISYPELPKKEQIIEGANALLKSADPINGGSKGAPKFPMSVQCNFMMRYSKMNADGRTLFYVERTLEMMYRGGIFDHLGGGFSRYTIDEKWLLPHFEKMLYDNALLIRTYIEMYEYVRKPFYREIAEKCISYVLDKLLGQEGGFYSAEDADSEGKEGAYYTWSWEEIEKILGKDAYLFATFYGVTPVGNFEGRNILHTTTTIEEFATLHKLDPMQLEITLKENREKLLAERSQRVPLQVDDKIIASWNGLMIHAFVKAGQLCNEIRYLECAERAAHFIKEYLWTGEKLFRRWREGEAKFDGCLDDYAFMIQGALSLFEADCSSSWLAFAIELTNALQNQFKANNGAFYLTNGQDPHLLFRRCEFYDGAEPSGNAVHAENLLRLYQITGVEDYLEQASLILKAAKEHMDLFPPGACYQLIALMRYLDMSAPTLIVSLNESEDYKEEIKVMLAGHFIPHKVVIYHRESDEELRDLAVLTRHCHAIGGKTALHICRRDRCDKPITDLSEMWQAIEKL